MFDNFLPTDVRQLTEDTSIALAGALQRQPIASPFSPTPIATAFVRQGEGKPAILLLHGFDSSVLEFRRLLPLLAREHATWAIDLLGFGFTERQVGIPFDPAAIRTHLYYSWKTLIGEPVILVGASMGGAAAIDFTLAHPEAVQRLVLIDAAGFAKGPAISRFLFPPLDYLAAEFLRRPGVREQVSRKAYVDQACVSADALLCARLHLDSPGWQRALSAFAKSGGYNALGDRIGTIAKPTLILWGDNDQILGTGDAERFRQAIPQSQLVWIDRCGHVPHLEKPAETAAAIQQFLTWS